MYRDRRRSCPGCSSPMEAVLIGQQEPLDRCAHCGGVFADYFDGEPSEIARRLAQSKMRAHPVKALERAPHCPDCNEDLVALPYLDGSAAVWRCQSCAAAFLTPGMLDYLADYRWHEEEPPGLLKRLVEWWRGFGSGPSPEAPLDPPPGSS